MRRRPFQHADNEVRQRWNAHGESLRQDDAHIALELGHTKALAASFSPGATASILERMISALYAAICNVNTAYTNTRPGTFLMLRPIWDMISGTPK